MTYQCDDQFEHFCICPRCDGDQVIDDEECTLCDGKGEVTEWLYGRYAHEAAHVRNKPILGDFSFAVAVFFGLGFQYGWMLS